MGRKCTLIVGLPASGKTTYAKTLITSTSILIDDPKHFSEIVGSILQDNLIIVDPHLCISHARFCAEVMLERLGFSSLNWIFFENNPEQCLINARKRGTKQVEEDIKYFSKWYVIPSSSTILPVYKC